ncbi:TPA: hypothetical protein DDW35_07315 [Candidatus Sumerlaeota bacterium]|nr:hypothetical protein [Candidatus Sumerlaeota bacterium]
MEERMNLENTRSRWLASFFLNVSRLFALAALLVAALAHPLGATPAFFAQWLPSANPQIPTSLCSAVLEGFCRSTYTLSVFREVLTLWMILPMLASWLTWKVLAGAEAGKSRREGGVLLLFLCYALFSLFWAPHFGVDHQSLYVAVNLLVWALFFIALIDLPFSRWFSRISVSLSFLTALILIPLQVWNVAQEGRQTPEAPLRSLYFAGGMAASSPVWGQGLDAYSVLAPRAQENYFIAHPNSTWKPDLDLAMVAKNDLLQLLAEMGVLGLGLAVFCGVLFFKRGRLRFRALQSRRERIKRLCALGGIVAILLLACVSGPFHQAGLSTLFIFLVALAYGSMQEDDVLEPSGAVSTRATAFPRSPVVRWTISVLAILFVWSLTWLPWSLTRDRLLANRLFNLATKAQGDAHEMVSLDGFEKQIGEYAAAREYYRLSLRLVSMDYQALVCRGMVEVTMTNAFLEWGREMKNQGNTQRETLCYQNAKAYAMYAMDDLKKASRMSGNVRYLAGEKLPEKDLGPRLNSKMLRSLSQACRFMARLQGDEKKLPEIMMQYFGMSELYAPTQAAVAKETTK